MFYGEVFKALNKARVKYVVAGGVAVVLHGYQRFTKDLDIIVALDGRNLEKLFNALKKTGYLPRVPVTLEQFSAQGQFAEWKKTKGMIVFSFVERKPPFDMIDMFIEEPIPFKMLHKERIDVKVGGMVIPVISIRHLIQIKEMAGREKDMDDIVQLKEIGKIKKKKATG